MPHHHYRKWCLYGTWRPINRALRKEERTGRDRSPEPTGTIIDSQSVETTEAGGERGYDAGKDVWGRERHVIVDTAQDVLDVVVHAANVQDRDGARLLLKRLWEQTRAQIQKFWADGAYKGDLVDWVQEGLGAVLDIVERDEDQDGFEVLPRRWVVERTFAWLGRYRRFSKDYDRCTRSSEGMIYLASNQTMAKRITANSYFSNSLLQDRSTLTGSNFCKASLTRVDLLSWQGLARWGEQRRTAETSFGPSSTV